MASKPEKDSNPFFLFANVNFVPDCYDAWQEAYDVLGKYVYEQEKTTEAYYFGVPVEYASDVSKTTHMLAFEIYGKKEDLYTTHFSSGAMAEFLKKIPPLMTTGLDLLHYEKVGGYLDRRNDLAPCGIMQDTRIKYPPSASDRDALVSAMQKLAKSVEDDESCKGVLTFLAFQSLDNDVDYRLFGRWDTRESMEKFLRRDDVLGFWASVKDKVVQMEWKNYVENGRGWLHR